MPTLVLTSLWASGECENSHMSHELGLMVSCSYFFFFSWGLSQEGSGDEMIMRAFFFFFLVWGCAGEWGGFIPSIRYEICRGFGWILAAYVSTVVPFDG